MAKNYNRNGNINNGNNRNQNGKNKNNNGNGNGQRKVNKYGAGVNKNISGNLWCNFCSRTGHDDANCRFKNTGNQSTNQQRSQGGSKKYCSYCDRDGHSDDGCYRNPASPNYKGAPGVANPGRFQSANGQQIPFSESCQLCNQDGHYAIQCPTRGLGPTTGQYFPQNYTPQTSWGGVPVSVTSGACSPGLYAQGNATMQWGAPPQVIQQQQSYGQQPFNDDILIEDEVSTRPCVPAPIQYSNIQTNAYFKGFFGYLHPESPCQRLQQKDRDGDFIMLNCWECSECVTPPRESDNFPWRWPILNYPYAS